MLQAGQFDDEGSPPANCLGPTTPIQISLDGSWKEIQEMIMEDEEGVPVVLVNENGKRLVTKARVLKSQLPEVQTAREWMFEEKPRIFTSAAHLLLLDESLQKEISACPRVRPCPACKASWYTGTYGQSTCHRCSPVQVNGYRPLVALDERSGRRTRPHTFTGHWYHIEMPKGFENYAIATGIEGILTEGFRHSLGTVQSDRHWTLNTKD
jgi:hypothetical protein